MTGKRKSALPPPPPGEGDERDWEDRRRVALEAWRMGQKLAKGQHRRAGVGRRIYRRRTAGR